jgi:protein farnesyltransferase/geranylgeranyltransferase type-1 subunit alpha
MSVLLLNFSNSFLVGAFFCGVIKVKYLAYTEVCFFLLQQRYLVVTRSPILGGLVAMRDSEVDYTVEAIIANPQNESPWRYLRGLYKGDNTLLVADDRISDACLKVLNNDWRCVFALGLLLELLRMGLQPSDELRGTIEAINNPDPETEHTDLATAVCSILQKCDPLRINYWSWYRTTLSS